MKTETKQIEGYLEKVKRSPKYFGYYLKKDGSPIVVENSDDSVIAELKSNGYWNSVQFINDAEGIKKHLKTYNSGFSGKRVIINNLKREKHCFKMRWITIGVNLNINV